MSEPRDDAGRGLTAASLVVVGLALIGLLAGTRKGSYEPLLPADEDAKAAESRTGARPARSYSELMVKPWAPELPHGAAVRRVLQAPGRDRVPASDDDARQEALAARADHRAFTGAPPSVPHPVSQGSGFECRTCHENGGMLGQVLAPPMSHSAYRQCTQCHVAEQPSVPTSTENLRVESSFEPLRGAPAPMRWSQAPPQMPHPSWMRERCSACHGDYGRHGLQTSHPERRSCLQCHAPAAVLEQMPRMP